VHLLLEEFEKKKKTNTVDPAARAGVKNVILFYFWWSQFCYVPQNDNHPENYLAKSGYKKNMKAKFLFNILLFFF